MNYNTETNRKYTVYMHVNKTNGKKYIGITSRKPKYRWNEGKNYIGCTRFYRAIQKYGWDGFENVIVAENLTESDAKQMEIQLIEKYNSINSEFGYNLTFGGEGNIPSKETRKRMSQAGKGRVFSEQHRKKIGDSNRRRILSEETKLKIAKSHIGKMTGSSNPKARKVINLDEMKTFDTIREASLFYNANENAISGCCSGIYKSGGGYRWMFYDEFLKTDEKTIKEILSIPIGVPTGDTAYNSKKVININTTEVFPTMREAAKKYNLDTSSLTKCCKGKTKTCGGYKWMYLEEYEKMKSAK